MNIVFHRTRSLFAGGLAALLCVYSNSAFAKSHHETTIIKEPAASLERVQISQEEFDQRMAGAHQTVVHGAIAGGIGLALLGGGIGMSVIGLKKSNPFLLIAGSLTATAGTVTSIFGGVALAKGFIDKNSIKRKYYTIVPTVSPNLYGLSLQMKF